MILRGLNKEQKKEILFFEQSQNIFIFSTYTDAFFIDAFVI